MCSKQKQRKRFGPFRFGVLIIFLVTSIALDVRATEPQKVVLALYGSRPDLPANVIVDEIIRSTLERELGPRLDFYAEFLDAARWPEAETQSAMRDFLRRRYAHKKLSAIIAVARPAINFIRLYGDELFPGVPIVVYGDLDSVRDWEPSRPITGALGKVDLSGTVELILRLQPQTREILVISGASASDHWLQSLAQHQLDQLEKRVKLTYMDTGSVEDFVSTVAQVPDGTVILFLSMYQDSAGNKLLSHEVLSRIAREARVPVYNQAGTHVGLGIVGGVVFNPESLGHETAQLTLRVLRGERLQDLPVQESKSSVPMVDWRQLKRWGLDEKRLPAGTIVQFRKVSVWQSHKWYIIGGMSLILAEALLILGLLWQRVKRRNAENELAITYDRLRMSIEAGRFVGWDWDFKTGTNRWFGNLETVFGIQSDNYFARGDEFRSRVHPEDRDAVMQAIDNAKRNRQPYAAEFRVPRENGHVRWVIARGRFYYASNGDPERMLGLAIDITERRLAEEALSSVSRRLIQAQERERVRIARELHDDINQRLAMLQVDVNQLRAHPSDSRSELQEWLEGISLRLSNTSIDVQAISHRLHSSKLEYLGVVAASKGFCREIAERQKMSIEFKADGVPPAVPQDVSLTLFRILQESLQNAVKHSSAQHVQVQLLGTSREVQLIVRDDGTGFNVDAAMNSHGLGLISMRERVNLVNGKIFIASKPMGGTEITVHVPIFAPQDAITDRAPHLTSGAA
jgi:PAS domain S-box-containing protein